jgi:hypothetical protein
VLAWLGQLWDGSDIGSYYGQVLEGWEADAEVCRELDGTVMQKAGLLAQRRDIKKKAAYGRVRKLLEDGLDIGTVQAERHWDREENAAICRSVPGSDSAKARALMTEYGLTLSSARGRVQRLRNHGYEVGGE